MKNNNAFIAGAAIAGILSGTIVAANAANTGATSISKAGSSIQALSLKDKGTHSCKGQNDCKGQGGCKSGDNGCKGKNSCKGKGGCATDGSKK